MNDLYILVSILVPILIILLMYRSDVKFYRDLYHHEAQTNNNLSLKIMDRHSNCNQHILDEVRTIKKSIKSLQGTGGESAKSKVNED